MLQFLGATYFFISLAMAVILFFVYYYYFIVEEWGLLIGGLFGWMAAGLLSMFFSWLWPFWVAAAYWDFKHEKPVRFGMLTKSDK